MSDVRTAPRLAIYGDVNPNIIDGSSVWLRTLCKLCLGHPTAETSVFLKAPLERGELLGDLTERPQLRLIPPADADRGEDGSMDSETAARRLALEQEIEPFDAVILRGWKVARACAARPALSGRLWVYLTDIPQSLADVTQTFRMELQAVVDQCQFLLCQTEELRHHLSNLLERGHSRLVLLPPLVPDEAFSDTDHAGPKRRGITLGYAGKFAPDWAIDELLDIQHHLYEDGGETVLHVVGDKFHRVSEDSQFRFRLQDRLQGQRGVAWHGGCSPQETVSILARCDVGYSMRRSALDHSLELSTKILEYGAAGLAALVNPTSKHRELLGEDYPLFAYDTESALAALEQVTDDPNTLIDARERCRALAEEHRLSRFQALFDRYIGRVFHLPEDGISRRLNVVLAGHDLKFCNELMEYFQARPDITLRIDRWKSLREHEEEHSRELLEWADVVLCEWCAGNAVWYSREMTHHPDKRLLIRFHRFEINSEFPSQVSLAGVHKMIFVGPHYRDMAQEQFDWPDDKVALIPNMVDDLAYDRPKFPGAEFNLGLVGYVPRLKRLDRALDILAALRADDPRYQLFVKGRHPWTYPWIWKKADEREFYEKCFQRIATDPLFQGAVTFDGFGSDIAPWLRKIGHILSVSDIESFHMAAAEGIASGSTAHFLPREGVELIFPDSPVCQSAEDLASRLLSLQQHVGHLSERQHDRDQITPYLVETARHQWDLLLGTG